MKENIRDLLKNGYYKLPKLLLILFYLRCKEYLRASIQ